MILWIPDGSLLNVRLRVTESPLVTFLIHITVRTEDFANPFVTLKFFSGRWLKGKTKS